MKSHTVLTLQRPMLRKFVVFLMYSSSRFLTGVCVVRGNIYDFTKHMFEMVANGMRAP